jgi:hypothetical protein
VQKGVPSGTYTWANAVAYCQTLTLAGHSDWRLPSLIELFSIVDFAQVNPPSINGAYFPSTPSNLFWSSSPDAWSPSKAWGVIFNVFSGGGTESFAASVAFPIRCVR